MASSHERLVLTASLTNDVARAAHGLEESASLIDEILTLEHEHWESVLAVGDVEYYQTKEGPFPNAQMRVSVRPSTGFAALSHTDHGDSRMTIANSYNSATTLPDVFLVFNGETGAVFPRSALILIDDARNALREWVRTRARPTCIEWQPFGK